MSKIFEPRAYQQKAVHDLRDALGEVSSVILYSPTGSGKTAMACDITAKAVAYGSRVLFLGDSLEIIDQTSESMNDWGISHGVIQSGIKNPKMWLNVHIATIQTLRNRHLPEKDLVFVDECHMARAHGWHKVIEEYISRGAKVIGLTATPCRLDGKGLGKLFQKIIYCPSIAELVDLGYLAKIDPIYCFKAPDTSDIKNPDRDLDKLGKRMSTARIVGDAVDHYARLAHGKLAIASCCTVEHSTNMTNAFSAAGINACHVDGDTPREARRRLLRSLRTRENMVLCQVNIAGKGFDCPDLEVAIDLCRTDSLAKWLQFIGRVMRLLGTKTTAMLFDHAGNIFHPDGTEKFGAPDDYREWSLDDAPKQPKDQDKVPSVSQCKTCFRAFRYGARVCPYCGSLVELNSRKIEVDAAQKLVEWKRERRALTAEQWREKLSKDEERKAKFLEFAEVGSLRGYKPGYAAMQFKNMFGQWPVKEWKDEAERRGYLGGQQALVEG